MSKRITARYDKPMSGELSSHDRALYLEVLLDQDLGALRREFTRTVSEQLGAIAGWLAIDAWLGGSDIAKDYVPTVDSNPRHERYAAFRGVSILIQMAAELSTGVVILLDAEKGYAASALIRQLVETEYLLRAFHDDISHADSWYRSTPAEIRKKFTPKAMRELGGFSDSEYWTHCEAGGHPAPHGEFLLRFAVPQDPKVVAETIWGDIAQHLRRVWVAANSLLTDHHARFTIVRSQEIAIVGEIETRWIGKDPFARPIGLNMLRSLNRVQRGQ